MKESAHNIPNSFEDVPFSEKVNSLLEGCLEDGGALSV